MKFIKDSHRKQIHLTLSYPEVRAFIKDIEDNTSSIALGITDEIVSHLKSLIDSSGKFPPNPQK